MNIARLLWLPAVLALPAFSLTACQGEEAEEEGVGTVHERTPGGSLGTTGTGADHPAPEEVRDEE